MLDLLYWHGDLFGKRDTIDISLALPLTGVLSSEYSIYCRYAMARALYCL